MQAASEANGDPNGSLGKKSDYRIRGIVLRSSARESQRYYEIEVIKENNTPIKVSGRFYGSARVPERTDKSKAVIELENGARIKILISGDPEISPIDFDVVDGESIAIRSDLAA
jgi:hypothetical protein